MSSIAFRRLISWFYSNFFDPTAIRFVFLCCYPFLILTAFVLSNFATTFTALRLAAAAVFNVVFFCIVTSVLRLIRQSFSIWLQRLLLIFLTLFTFISVMHFLLYKQLLGLPSIYAILDTTPAESSEFVSAFQRTHLSTALVLTSPLIWFSIWPPRLRSLLFYRPKLLFFFEVCLLLICGYWSAFRPYVYMNNPLLLTLFTVPEAIHEKAVLEGLYANFPAKAPVVVQFADEKPKTHVLVIGEATTSRHMSLYGYSRNTTPKLDHLRSDLEIVLDACSSRGNTTAQLKEFLTFASREDPEPLLTAPHLLQLMKSAGFKTFWLSNQQTVGATDSWSAVFAKPADFGIFINKRGFLEGNSFDEKLIPFLRSALADQSPRRFIVMHLIGTHHAYDLRYPKAFAQFDHLSIDDSAFHVKVDAWNPRYNQYDNAVLYNDHVLSEIIDLVKRAGAATLTYVSDHGEALGESSDLIGHYEGLGPRQVYQVPLIFFLSDSTKTELGERLETFRFNLAKPMQTDWLIHTLLDLYGVYHANWRADRSMLSPKYTPGPRYCDSLKP